MPHPEQRPTRALIAVAAPREADAIARGFGCPQHASCPIWNSIPLSNGFDLVRTGVGPAAASGGVARTLDPAVHRLVLSLGVAGALPGASAPALGAVLLSTRSEFADLGLTHPSGFESIGEMGFATTGSGDVFTPDAALRELLAPYADALAPIATVSVCSGTDALAEAIRDRVGAGEGPGGEAMEGAAVGLVAQMLRVRFAEMRVISNTTGDRESQRWDLDSALDRLAALARSLAAAGLTRADPGH